CVFERALSVATQRRHRGGFGTEALLSAHGHDIEAPISVNVAKGEYIVLLIRIEGCSRPWRKTAASVSEQRSEGVTALIRSDDVKVPISVEIHEMKAACVEFDRRARSERRSGAQAEAALAIAKKNIDVIPVAVSDD